MLVAPLRSRLSTTPPWLGTAPDNQRGSDGRTSTRQVSDLVGRVRVVAVSPLIGGRAVKGPADRMLARLAGGTSPRRSPGTP